MDSLIAEIGQRGKLYEDGYVGSDEEEEMPQAERDLAEDAQWKIFQKNTFTRWANEHLKQAKTSVNDIQMDFADGLKLISLVEVLSGQKFSRINKRPNFRTQKLENVTMVLKFLEEHENLKLVNIDSTDIVDSRLKLILGLIWTLILHYSISMPMWEGEEELPQDAKGKGPTPKQRIVSWVNSKMPDMPVKNLTNDWNNGIAIGALVDACAPGLCPDWDTWGNRKPIDNATEAMNAAEQWLDVPQLIRPEEMIDPKVDEKAMMTYLSQFPNAKLKEGAPLRPKINPARVRAYGPGLQATGNTIGAPARFTVETFSAGRANLEVIVLMAGGATIPCEIIKNEDRNLTYSCSYVPKTEGEYRIIIKYSSKEVANSPFVVNVQGAPGDPSKVKVSGPGVEENGGNAIGRRTFFNAFTNDAGAGLIACEIVDPRGQKDSVKPLVTRADPDGPYLVEYTPKLEGQYQVNVLFAGRPIAMSPFSVNVGPPAAMSALKNTEALKGQRPANIKQQGMVFPSTNKQDSNEKPIPLVHEAQHQNLGQAAMAPESVPQKTFTPGPDGVPQYGMGTSPMAYGGMGPENMPQKGTFAQGVLDAKTAALHASSPGTKIPVAPSTMDIAPGQMVAGGIVPGPMGHKNIVPGNVSQEVMTPGAIGLKGKAPEPMAPNGVSQQGSMAPRAVPTVDPAKSNQKPEVNSTLAYATGRGVQEKGIRVQEKVIFQVHTENAGVGDLTVELKRPDGQLEVVNVTKVLENIYQCSYTPSKPGQYILAVQYAGGSIRNAPFDIIVAPATDIKVRAFGPGLQSGIIKQNNLFTVVSNDEPGKLGFVIKGPSQAEITCTDNGDNSAEVSYVVDQPGEYAVHITCNKEDITGSPFMAQISEPLGIDVSKIKVTGKGISPTPGNVVMGQPTEFTIDMTDVMPSVVSIANREKKKVADLLMVECHDSMGDVCPVAVTEISTGKFVCKYTPMTVGVITVHMAVAGVGLRESGTRISPLIESNDNNNLQHSISPLIESNDSNNLQHSVPVGSDLSVNGIKLFGPGLESAKVKQPTQFTIDLREAFPAQADQQRAVNELVIGITDASGNTITPKVRDLQDGTYHVEYTGPDTTSALAISVIIADQQVGQSPYVVPVSPGFDVSKIRVADLDSPVKASVPQTFKILTVAPNPHEMIPSVVIKQRGTGNVIPVTLKKTPQGYDVAYMLPTPGIYTAQVLDDLFPVAGPFNVEAVPSAQPVPAKGTKPAELAKGSVIPGTPVNPLVAAHNANLRQAGIIKPNTPLKTGEIIPMDLESPQMAAPVKRAAVLSPLQTPIMMPEEAIRNAMRTNEFAHPLASANVSQNIVAEQPILASHQAKTVDAPVRIGPYNPEYSLEGPGKYGNSRPPILPEDREYAKQQSSWPQPTTTDPAGKVTAYGPGLEKAMATLPAEFTVDSTKSIPASLNVTMEGPQQPQIVCHDNGNQTCGVTYIPPVPGKYIINVLYDGNTHIEGSPFVIQAYPVGKMDLNVDQIKVYGPGIQPNGVYKKCLNKFIVDAREIDKVGEEVVAAIITTPDNQRFASEVVNRHDGTYLVTYSAIMEGPHQINLTYGGVPIPSSPFPVNVSSGFDSSRVRAYGPGLESSGDHLAPDLKTEFTVDMNGAGEGGLGLTIGGPADAVINCIDNKDGTCTMEYTPTMAGAYDIHIKFNDEEIPSSPFHVRVHGNTDVSKVRCYGPGIESDKVRANCPATFLVDTRQAGDASIEATFTPFQGAKPVQASVEPVTNEPGVYECTYIPQAEGPCNVNVMYDGQPVVGSPFQPNVRPTNEPNKVRISGAGIRGPVQASMPSTFTVDVREAGAGDLSLDVKDPVGQSLPISMVPINENELQNAVAPTNDFDHMKPLEAGEAIPNRDTGMLACTYEPFIIGEHKIHVMYAGTEIPESPFVFDSVPVGRADLCVIKDGVKPRIAIGDEACVTVNKADAGFGQLKARVTHFANGKAVNLPVETEDNGDGTVTVYYTPMEAGQVHVELRYGGQLIPNGEFTQQAVPAEELEIFATPIMAQYNPVDFRLVVAGKQDQELQAMVVRPSGGQEPVDLKENNDGTVAVNYKPREKGMHELHVSSLSEGTGDVRMPLAGSPYRFYVDNAASGNVTAYGPGLSHGVTGQPAEFTVVMKDVGADLDSDKPRGLSVSVEGPSKAKISCLDNEDGTCRVTYLPMAPGEYTINLKFMDKNIAGSPFTAKITGEPKKQTQMNVSSMSCISFDVGNDDISQLIATVTSPSGKEEPCVLKKLPNNHMGISFTPKEYGEHLVNVFKAGKHIPKSPFRITVSRDDVGDPNRVRVIWPDGVQPMANQRNEFMVDSKDAGYATLSLSIEGPSKAEIECTDNSDGTCTVGFCPTEPGLYHVNVKYADQHVPGSPFTIQVGGEPSTKLVQRIVRRREAFETTKVGSTCGLTMRLPAGDIRGMTAEVLSPSGKIIPCELVPINDDQLTIKFIPEELGIHNVSIFNRGVHIPGSPFQFTVGQPADGGADKVRVAGRGLEYGIVDERNEFSIYTREAGAGGLSIAIEGPSKAEIFFEDQRDGSCVVFYRVRKPGEYTCSIKFKDEHIPFSPFNIYVSDPKEAGKIEAYEIPVQHAIQNQARKDSLQIGRPVTLTVHCLDSEHLLLATVESPSKKVMDASVHNLDGDQYVVRFVPQESGTHFIHVYMVPQSEAHLGVNAPNRHEIEGSPYCILVGEHTADPGSVHASGEGLTRGAVGKKNKFHVNTANAGTGILSVLIDGPSKVQVTCEEREDGYEFAYVVSVPGEYKISIKYGGNFDIYGSPFYAQITGSIMGYQSDLQPTEQTRIVFNTENKTMASHMYEANESLSNGISANVVVSGFGLKYGLVGKDNQFHIDASKAGNAVLLAGMSGPKHPCDRFNIQHIGNNRFSINYRVEEAGLYWLAIKWGDDHVPGSPFKVVCTDPQK